MESLDYRRALACSRPLKAKYTYPSRIKRDYYALTATAQRRPVDDDNIFVYFDTAAQINVYKDKLIVKNMRAAKTPIRLHGVDGDKEGIYCNLVADGPGGIGYYVPSAALNLVSLGHLIDSDKSTRYCDKTHTFIVEGIGSKPLVFRRCAVDGLFKARVRPSTPPAVAAVSTRTLAQAEASHHGLDTIGERMGRFTPRERKKAAEAKELMRKLMSPTSRHMLQLVKEGVLGQGPNGVTAQDVVNSVSIYGKDLGRLKGMSTASKPLPIPRELRPARRTEEVVDMHVDLLFANDTIMACC
jgi:hypothetical protein